MSMYGTLVGIEVPPASLNLEVKPYGVSGLQTDLTASPVVDNETSAEAGLDVKYGITENLIADLTYNTDFAQVEVDEQQVNLTRFSLFFPEKREFFLESRGLFEFGRGGFGGGSGGGSAPTLFHSRRIGLQSGRPIPILAGARVTGKVGPFDVGLVTLQTDDEPNVGAESTNFSVVRLRRDVFARSSIGVLFGNRSASLVSSGANQAYGADASFSFLQDAGVSAYYARTATEGLTGNDRSYRARLSYSDDLWGGHLDHLVVGDDFNPEIGFVRRRGFRQSAASSYWSPRPRFIGWIRQLTLLGSIDYFENDLAGFVESRTRVGSLSIDLESSDRFSASVTDRYENFPEATGISGATISPGRYSFRDVQVGYTFGSQRRISARLSVRRGTFYTGELTSVSLGRGRIEVLQQLSVEPSVQLNWLDLPEQAYAGEFNQHVARTRITYSVTPRTFLSALVQYNSRSDALSGNFRLRWEWAPGSELFIVYTEERFAEALDRWGHLQNRGLVIKVNRLLRF